jgi:hypothetical protein
LISRNEYQPRKIEERFFIAIKGLTVDGYYTSELGSTRNSDTKATPTSKILTVALILNTLVKKSLKLKPERRNAIEAVTRSLCLMLGCLAIVVGSVVTSFGYEVKR